MTTRDESGGQEQGEFRLRPMSQADAEEIAAWRYPGEYSFYDVTSDPEDRAELLDPQVRAGEYVAVSCTDGELIGFFQYKHPRGARLEIGLGLRPRWTGQGLGGRFLEAGLDYARRNFAPQEFTLSVVGFNRRAITVYERAGFETVRRFNHRTNGRDWEFVEMRRPA